jgi:ring-1,2-phenylacetyl-CoA epoxidase subunit PaaC
MLIAMAPETGVATARFESLLRLSDSTLILAQRLAEWCGKAPALEEDIALSNVALDLIGQTRLWLAYAGETEGAGRTEDQLAYLRDAHDFRNLLLVEQPNGNYADTIVRQFYFDAWHYPLLQTLARSTDQRIAGIAAKAVKEVAYHLRRSGDLVVRMGDGTADSHAKTQAAADKLWMYTGEMFERDGVDDAMIAQGMAGDAGALREPWLAHVREVFAEATLTLPAPEAWMQTGGRRGRHTENLGYILAEMQFLQRAYPGAQW